LSKVFTQIGQHRAKTTNHVFQDIRFHISSDGTDYSNNFIVKVEEWQFIGAKPIGQTPLIEEKFNNLQLGFSRT